MTMKPANPLRTLAMTDVLRAALLVLAMAFVGLCLFVLAVLAVSNLGTPTLDPAALEPGLGLSNQALTIAFALAGALASTIVAYAALRAQTSANDAQTRSIATAEKARVYAELRRDLLRHAAVIGAFHTVFSRAHEITEDLLRSLTDQLAQGPQQLDLPSRDADHTAAILGAHHSFWQAIADAQKTERPDLALDQLWLARHAGGKAPSRLINLGRAFGFFGLKGTATADPLPPSTLAARGTPMTLAVAQDILRLARHGVSRLAQGEISMALARAYATPSTLKTHMADAQTNLGLLASAAQSLPQSAAALQADSDTLREAFNAIRAASNELSEEMLPDAVAEALQDQLDDLRDRLSRLSDDTDELTAFLPMARKGAVSAMQADETFRDLIGEAFEDLATLGFSLTEAAQKVAPQSHARLILARHGAGPSGDAVAALSAFVAGAIVLPDGALLCAGQPHMFVAAEWKANLGLALFEDLSRLYIDQSADTDGTLDLARLIPDDRRLGGQMFDTPYGQDRVTQIGALPAAFDALWLMLRKNPETLALLTLQDASLFAQGQMNFAGALQPSAGAAAKALDLLGGGTAPDLVLTLDPALEPDPTN